MQGFTNNVIEKVNLVRLTPAGCGLDLGDGSERAEYVPQDYVLERLGRPHRNINIMYTYYPNDKEWPARISEACTDMEIHFQWDYPYDDYFPYGGGIGGSVENEPFPQIRDIRKHGQDVTLTLTIDCGVSDEHLVKIAQDLRRFGRINLRINHEAAGDWFTHSRRYSYEEVGAFFVRFHNIIKREARNVRTIFCAGAVKPDGSMDKIEAFREAYLAADAWSNDCYLCLHYGWPFDVCEKDGKSFAVTPPEQYYETLKKTAAYLKELNGGVLKPFMVCETNVDGDVTGPVQQGDALTRFMKLIREEEEPFLNGFTLYQFRDRGRLGLEIENPNNRAFGIEQPLMTTYKQLMKDPYYMPGYEEGQTITVSGEEKDLAEPIRLRWGSAEDADGAELSVTLEKMPVFFELNFEEALNLMIEVNGRWFYKAPEVNTVDVMGAFFTAGAEPVREGQELKIRIFAPPANGENPETDAPDWDLNCYTEMKKLPGLRIRYEAVALP